ncbi:bifunctional 2-polyprenyl-6-hydroxyphenol methylase/3-demethylubiquinol 3-O-methyltransferase UbiG [Microbacterium sp. cf046]|uniref:class I SAM-dependent methyltransferase n=1 Tax=Microbacterium sp. cf046 TaxID=1761803 RepID=UPI000B84AA4F|nr:class I SAM-dependent methyltransferase [Microbacterium sp. cf046]
MQTEPRPEGAPVDFWEERYAGTTRIWSGSPNSTLVDVVSSLEPGRALDLGCGEGADAIWLAQQGWKATGVDISATAVARARAAASDLGLDESRARFVAADLSTWQSEDAYDLVTASFLQSPVALSRPEILRSVADRIAQGGHLLVISHAAAPPWSRHHHEGGHGGGGFPTPAEELAGLDFDDTEWATVIAEVRSREAVGPDGHEAALDDSVVLLRRMR